MKNNIFVNTIPHSGTHLVTAFLDQMGYSHAELYNRFYTKKPYYRRWQRAGINWRTSTDLGNHIRFFSKTEIPVSVASPRMAKSGMVASLLSKIDQDKYIIGHMPFSEAGNTLVKEYIAKTITIIRDPRDMALSMLNHIRERTSHMAHAYLFSHLQNEGQRLIALVNGYDNSYGRLVGLERMYRSMLPWKNTDQNMILRFEDLVGEKGGGQNSLQFDAVQKIINHIETTTQYTNEKILSMGSASFGKTTTFRKGQIGRWAEILNEKDKDLFKNTINDLLIELNYESNLDW